MQIDKFQQFGYRWSKCISGDLEQLRAYFRIPVLASIYLPCHGNNLISALKSRDQPQCNACICLG